MQPEFFALPVVKILLIAVVFLALLIEIKTAGMGIGALIGLVAAGVFFGSQFVTGLISLYEIAIFLGGVVCIAIEILTPGAGVFAGIGILAILYSFMLALGGNVVAIYFMLTSLALAIIIFAFIVKRLPSSKLWGKIVLKDMSTSNKGYVSAGDYSKFYGQEGIVLTGLRPAGTALIGDVKLDVVSEGSYIEKGEQVKVVAVNGARIVVRKL